MRPYLPAPLELPWKFDFFNLRRKQLYSEVIVKHTQAIEAKLTRPSSGLLERLSCTEFWDSLDLISEYDPKIESLRNIWQKIEPLAHLNSQQLLALYEEDVLPLERGYRYFVSEKAQEVASQLNENLERIERLKSYILEGLLYRSMAYQLLNTPRHVDDIVAAVCHGVNQLNYLEEPLLFGASLSQTLNDDRRLTIHDLLKNAGVDEKILEEKILKDMPKYGFAVLFEQIEIEHRLNKMNEFCRTVVDKLNFGQFSERLFSQSTKDMFAQLLKFPVAAFFKDGLEFIKNKIQWKKVKDQIEFLFKLKYILYFVLSISTYYLLMQFLTPILFLFVNTTVFNTISSVLFYTVAMAPAWAYGWKFLKDLKNGIHNYLVCWKKQEVLDSLVALERAEHCIANKLSQVIVDVAHFDIEQLMTSVKNCQAQLQVAKKGLKRFAPGEEKMCQGTLMEQIILTEKQIDIVEVKLLERLNLLAKHIASRIGEEIEGIENTLNEEPLTPMFPVAQLEKLEQFVRTYGDKEDIDRFSKETNIIDRWLDKIEHQQFVQKTQNALTLDQPWGRYDTRKALLRKWEPLLSAFTKNPQERAAAIELNNLFLGKTQMTKEHLCQLVSKIRTGKEARGMMEKVQTFIFDTLDPRVSQNASLVSKEQREEIQKWYVHYKDQIEDATKKFSTILENEMDDENLATYYELLDSADIYSYSSGENADLDQRQNLARQTFEAYEGEKSFAYRLIRFIPRNEQASFTRTVASKRLTWIVSQLGNGLDPTAPFEKADIELFQEMVLMEERSEFDFNRIIGDAINRSHPSMRLVLPFLETCRSSGIDTIKLMQFYRQAQRNGYNPILHQLEAKQSCAQEIISSLRLIGNTGIERDSLRVTH